MRITLTEEDFLKVHDIIANAEIEHKEKMRLMQLLSAEQTKASLSVTDKKRNSTGNANEAKRNKAIEGIKNSVERLKLKKMKINANTISNESGLAYNTVKKYKYIYS